MSGDHHGVSSGVFGRAAEAKRIGIGAALAPSHHGEIIQGTFAVGKRYKDGLVTMPCKLYNSYARFYPGIATFATISPTWKTKARRAATLAIEAVGKKRGKSIGGHVEVFNEAPVGQGFGTSTSDVLATIRAVCDAFSEQLAVADIARLVVAAETASDSVMFDESAVLFAQREGEIIEDFGKPLPQMLVVGLSVTPDPISVDTLALKPITYSAREIGVLGDLRTALREAVFKQDVKLVGRVATMSAEINQKYRPLPNFARIAQLADEVAAAGVQVSHSGSIVGLLFEDSTDALARMEHLRSLLNDIGIYRHWRFKVDG
jgi:uncharacterized protein involved in propanediol utilization